MGTIYLLQIMLAGLGAPGLVATSVAFVGALVFVVALGRFEGFARLGVRGVSLRFVVAGVLVGLSAWYIDLRLVVWLEPPGDPAPLAKLVGSTSLIPTLFAVAVLPAITEELVFRGVLARALAQRSLVLGIVGSAAAFSLYHLQPIQMLATFPLGLALAILALRSDSVVPSMIAHFLNNATAILLSREVLPSVGAQIGDHPDASLAIALVVVTGGLALAAKEVA